MQIESKYIDIQAKKLWTKHITHNNGSDSDTIVFLHDALGSIEQWKDFPERIAERTGYDILLYDRLGHGESDPNDQKLDNRFFDREALMVLPELLKKLEISHPVLYGHSDGGTIALIYSSVIQTKALILEAAHILVEEETKAGVIKTSKNRNDLVSKLEKYHGKKAVKLFDEWSSLWSGELMNDWNIEYLLNRIDVPVLIIQGEEDEYATLEQVRRIAHGISSESELYMPKGVGHTPHKEISEDLLNRIESYFNTHL